MAISPFKTFSAGEILTAADLNSSFTQITDNGEDLGWPATKAKDLDGQEFILDTDADTSVTADTDDRIDFRLGGVDLFLLDGTTASSVNGFTLASTATGVSPTVSPQGSDTNIGINLTPKGTGLVEWAGDTLGWVVLASSDSVSAASTLEFLSLSTNFRAYLLVITDADPVTDDVDFQIEVSDDNGSTWKQGATDYHFTAVERNSAALTSAYSAGATEITATIAGVGNAAEEFTATIMIIDPQSAGTKTTFHGELSYEDAASGFIGTTFHAQRNADEANDAFRVFFSSGNINTLRYTLYGLRVS